ncbi:hypothetical protein [Methylococcus geothermalis]|uniref:Uncharacterized protein n=1 Tax=Methylococcus geothermalis TaxID=2681310 RepID=A0A858Q6L8_9GAMM|nr:hypothetical protein [Methylococcus geothermalis]QJD29453.1 hypothetical protein GNH96_05420 [Methylococcus geothermalis]
MFAKSFLLPAALLGASQAALATPNMYWDHMQSALSQAECVSRGESLMTAQTTGKISKDADSVRSWNDKTLAVIECIRMGDHMTVMVLVGSDDAAAGSKLLDSLKKGMQ